MITTGTVKDINMEIMRMKEALRHTTKKEERVAINNYILNLIISKEEMTGRRSSSEKERIFNAKNPYAEFNGLLSDYECELISDYLKHKSFHTSIIDKIIKETEDYLDDLELSEEDYKKLYGNILGEKKFKEIFMEFLKKYKLDGLFEKLVKRRNIYITQENDNNTKGFSLYNPLNDEGRIFISKFNYNMDSMFTLAHEMGHIYDYKMLEKNQRKRNKFMYVTFYAEVISILFERLFLNYLFKNNIYVDEARILFDRSTDNKNDFLLTTYILNLLDDEIFLSGKYHYMSGKEVYRCIKNNFKGIGAKEFLSDFEYFDVSENFTYVYGDIISLILQDIVERYGLENDVVKEFFEERYKSFDESFFERNNITPEEYIKRYKRDFNLMKK